MGNVVKLPNGGCMYSHEEIEVAVSVYTTLLSDFEKASSNADDYANVAWKKLPIYKRLWFSLKSGIFMPKEWYDFYQDCYMKGMKKWEGCGKIISRYTIQTNHRFAAEDLVNMEKSKRNCYLNPIQISTLVELTSLKDRLES